jgi:PAS domain S-box-containing protein
MKFKNIDISKKFIFIFSTITGSLILGFTIIFIFFAKQKNTTQSIDLIARNRMLTLKISAMSQLISSSDPSISIKAKEELRKALDDHEKNISVLKSGGSASIAGNMVSVQKAPEDIQEKLKEISAVFADYKKYCDVLLKENRTIEKRIITNDSLQEEEFIQVENATYAEAHIQMQKLTSEGFLLKLNSELTDYYIKQSSTQLGLAQQLLFLTFVVVLGIIIFSYLLADKFIVKPIHTIATAAAKISLGDANVKSEYQSKDEMGKISTSINTLVDNLIRATVFTEKIGEGDFSTRLDGDNQNSLNTALLKMRDKLRVVADEDKKRNWSVSGLAQIGELLRKTYNSSADLYNGVLSFVIKYLGANQGALYVINATTREQYIEMVACYAYEKRKYVDKKIALKEGLVGQCILEKQSILLTEIPNNYVEITSGLGQSNPSCILLVPLKNNDEIHGVIEIASFKVFTPYEVSFIEKLSESVASSITTVKVGDNTKKLLDELQLTSEQMRAQEEEMRQNMEELMATQEQMEKSQMESREGQITMQTLLENYHVGIFTVNEEGTLLSVNNITEKITGYISNELTGNNIRLFLKYLKLDNLSTGNKVREKVTNKEGSTFTVEIVASKTVAFGESAYLFLMRDISSEMNREQDLMMALDQNEQQKKEFQKKIQDLESKLKN